MDCLRLTQLDLSLVTDRAMPISQSDRHDCVDYGGSQSWTYGNREVRRNGGEGLVDVINVFGLGVQSRVVDVLVVDAIYGQSPVSILLEFLLLFPRRQNTTYLPRHR